MVILNKTKINKVKTYLEKVVPHEGLKEYDNKSGLLNPIMFSYMKNPHRFVFKQKFEYCEDIVTFTADLSDINLSIRNDAKKSASCHSDDSLAFYKALSYHLTEQLSETLAKYYKDTDLYKECRCLVLPKEMSFAKDQLTIIVFFDSTIHDDFLNVISKEFEKTSKRLSESKELI